MAGVVAQLVEHHNGIVGVRGSNPLGSTSLSFGFRGYHPGEVHTLAPDRTYQSKPLGPFLAAHPENLSGQSIQVLFVSGADDVRKPGGHLGFFKFLGPGNDASGRGAA